MSIENCLLKIPRISEEFSVAHIIQAVGDYTKDGLERKSAEKRAVSDQIADLEERRAEIQRTVAMAYSARARQEPSKPEPSPSLMERIITSKGPAFDGQDISLRADGFVGGSKDRHRFTIADAANKDEWLGDLVLGIENGKIARLHVLTVGEEKRGEGIGSRVVKSIVETAGGPVQIRDITPDSLEFWRKVGLYNETEEARHGTISPASNARAEKVSEARRRAPEGADKASARGPRTQSKEKAARIERLASYLKEQLGEKTFSKLKGKVFQLVSEEDIPQSVRAQAEQQAPNKPIAGYVHRGVPHVVVENVTTDGGRSDAFAVLMHEVGVHTGLRGMLGEKLFSELLSAVEDAANGKGDPRMVIAAHNVKLPKGTPESLRSEELAAYIVQDMATQDVPLMKKVWAALKAFLYRLGITTEIDPLMLRELARGAMNHVAKVMTVNEMDSMFAYVWHGTPHVWPPEPGFPHGRPRLDKIGTGEGAQAYGHGWYSAEAEDVGREYKERLSSSARKRLAQNERVIRAWEKWQRSHPKLADAFIEDVNLKYGYPALTELGIATELQNAKGGYWKAETDISFAERVEYSDDLYLDTGSLYRLEIPDDVLPHLLQWDKPLSEQTPEVRTAIQNSPYAPDDINIGFGITGAELYELIAESPGRLMGTPKEGEARPHDNKAASEYLNSIGIVGNRYLDQGSRGKGEGTSNFVIWDQPTLDRIALLEHNGEKLDAIREAESGAPKFSFADTISEQASNYLTRWKGISLWRRTVGSPYDLAKRDKDKDGKPGTLGTFGYFFKYAQAYMRTSSGLAIQSESLAPSFLLRMDRLQDAFKRGLQKADIALVGTSLYEGTLSDPSGNPLKGKRWTEDEFRAQYSADPKMWALYEEARAAVDDSIDTNAKGVAVKLARTFGILQSIEAPLPDIVKDTAKQANAMLIQESKDLPKKEGALTLLEDTLKATPKTDKDKRKELRKRVKSAKKEVQSAKDKVKGLEKLIEDVEDIQEHAGKLKDHGYFPLMRFGEYTITAHPVDKTQPITFLRFESQADANRMLKAYQADPEFEKVVKGVLNEKEFEMYKGITTETMSMFIKKLPIGNHAAVQTFMEEVVSTRSALKRMLHRKGIPGYDTDMVRTLASFITSNARMASMNAHLQDMEEGIQAIPKEKGDFRGYANDLKKYLMEPKEEAQGIRSFLFFYFIGMSPASAIVQASQPVMMSYPYLSQFIGTRKAAAYITQAMGEAVVHATPKDVKEALERARREGVTAPHETHLMQAMARGAVGAHGVLNKGMKIWGSFFSLTEQFNREATFIAAYRIGVKLKGQFDIKDPYAFAVDAVDGTQLIYSRVNRAPWARGPIGSTIMTFQAFKVGYIEFLMRLPRKERAVAITLLLLAAGTAGFPGADDLDDVIDTVLQLGGYPSQIAKTKHELIQETLGEAWGDVFERGLSVLTPTALSLRMGFGDLFPGTAVIKPSETDREREVTQMLGPLGGVLLQGKQALERGIRGDVKGATFAMVPKAARDVWKAIEMWQTGQFQDIKGRLKLPATKRQAITKALGFQPTQFARAAEESTRHYEALALHKLKRDEIAELWSEGKATLDSEKVSDAKEMRNEWNRDHPDMKIDISPQSIRQRVKSLRMTELQRQRRSTPRSMRQ